VIETVARLDRVAQGKVVRADDIGSLQCDEKRALHGPGADPLDLGKPPDHLLVRQLAQSGLGQASVAEAPRQIQHGGGLAPRQPETTYVPWSTAASSPAPGTRPPNRSVRRAKIAVAAITEIC
jgi:hypothetical protein